MGSEQIGALFYERNEQLTPLERFELLLNLMKIEADKHSAAENGWQVLPQVGVKIKREVDEEIDTQFFIFAPAPSPGYISRYSPSITMELGCLTPEPESNRLNGQIERKYVRRDFLEESSPSYPDHHEQAAGDLEQIKNMFYVYKNSIEILEPIE